MANIRSRYRLGNLSLTLALAMAVSLSAAAQQKSKFTATPLSQGATYAVGATTGSGTAGARPQAQTRAVKRVSVIVKLADPSLAAYKGGIAGMAATSPAVTGATTLNVASPDSKKYLSYLADKQ